MVQVKFLTKNVQENDPNYRLVSDRREHFSSFNSALQFVNTLRSQLSSREVLMGRPEIELV